MTNPEIVCDMLHRQWNLRDITAVDDAIAENHIDHNPTPGQAQGRAGVRAAIQALIDTADNHCEIHESFGSGDLVATRYTMTSTHSGDMFGIPAAGKTTKAHVVEIDRLENGVIVESWGEYNSFEMMQQLGVIPEGIGH